MLVPALRRQFGFTHTVLRTNAEGVTQAESLTAPPGGGSSFNWVLGHVLVTRGLLLGLLGQEPVGDEETRGLYGRGTTSMTDPARAVALERLLADLDTSQERLLAGLDGLDELRLKATPSPSVLDDTPLVGSNLGECLAGLQFHEAYHAGQLGVLRRVLGKPPMIR